MCAYEHGFEASKIKSTTYATPTDTEEEYYLWRNSFEVGALWMADRVNKGDKLLD